MTERKKIWLNTILFFLILGLTIYGVFHGKNLSELYRALLRTDIRWLFPAVCCVFFFIWGESIIIWYMLKSCGFLLKKSVCFLFSSVGFFFSCVTPSASGGQPMQIYFMKKKKIPIPTATVILMIVTITYKLVLVLIGLALLLFAQDFVTEYLSGIYYIFLLGLGLNIFCVAFMILLVFHPHLSKRILLAGLNLLTRLHLVKHKEERIHKLEDSMEIYKDTAAYMGSHLKLMIEVLFITFAQRIALFSVTYFVCLSMGLTSVSYFKVMILTAVISVSVDMLPLPGGMGISETLFSIIFQPVFGVLILPGMILSRGLGYYSELLISAIFTLVTIIYFQQRRT